MAAILSNLRGISRRFRLDARGVTAIEFAFVAPVLFLLTMGTIEVGLMMFNMSTIEGGLREAARFSVTGQEATDGQRQAQIIQVLKQYAIGPVDLDDATVTMKIYDSFNDVNQPEPFTDTNGNGQYDQGEPYEDLNNNGKWDQDRGTDGAGAGGQVVRYEVDYTWNILTPIMRQFFGTNGQFPMSASIVVRNEPCPFGTVCNASQTGWSVSQTGN